MGINANDLPTAGDYAFAQSQDNKEKMERSLKRTKILEDRIKALEEEIALQKNINNG